MQQLSMINQSKNQQTTTVINGLIAKSKNSVIQIAPGIAQRILDEMNFHGQRKIKEARIVKHARRIAEGLWKESFPITFAMLPSGDMWLIDGQHRLQAAIQLGVTIKVAVIVASCETEGEARRLYAGFDEPDSKRSASEVMDAVELPEKLDLPRAFASRVFSALPILSNDLEPQTGSAIEAEKYVRLFSTDARLGAIGGWKNEAACFYSVMKKTSGKVRAKLMTGGVLACALYTFRHQPAKANQFWHGLAENDGLKRDDPRSALLRDFFERNASVGALRQNVQASVLAWNAFCEGRPLKIIKCITGAAIAPWGTPIQKRK